MKTFKTLLLIMMFALGAMTWVGCDNDGPMENAGETVDEAVEDMGDAAEEAGNDIEDAVDDAQDKMD
ncbi:MAG: hypothetical protein CMJ19_05835 [Phycisphaeraceae bacterium]|nr:hypothetical protein [Phycisphaeraceae bacterium]|tara:strand:+ start:981 stop:1181 length:201 start_codon:yes stop_codon:yes gene_type:complete